MAEAIRLENVSKLFPTAGADGRRTFTPALRSVSLSVEEGSLTVVAGANGSGKSVLMSLVAGLSRPSGGTVWTKSRPGLVFQDAATQILGDTPREDVAVGPANARVGRERAKRLVEDALGSVRLSEKADFPAEFLSGGEKRRLAVAAILAMERDIIVFDEPYANLDYPAVVDVNRLLDELHGSGRTVVLLTHELEKCLALADHFVVLSRGSVVYDGSPADALSLPLEKWAIRNPLARYESAADLVWR